MYIHISGHCSGSVMVQFIYLYIHIYKWRWTPPQCIAVDTASIYSLDLKRWTPPPCIERVIQWLGVWMVIVGSCGFSIQSCKEVRCNCSHGWRLDAKAKVAVVLCNRGLHRNHYMYTKWSTPPVAVDTTPTRNLTYIYTHTRGRDREGHVRRLWP